MTWQVLQISDALDREFLAGLTVHTPALGWVPDMSLLAMFSKAEREEMLTDPVARVRHFPLQRGYSRPPFSWLGGAAKAQLQRMKNRSDGNAPLICTTPYWADLAARWNGPVVYYLTDLMVAYAGADPDLVLALDAKMCAAATLVCPNSERIADYLCREAGCDRSRIEIIPNATREANLLAESPAGPSPCPPDIASVPRPIAGVIGNLSSNMDWVFLRETIARTPDFSWVFVGPTSMDIPDPAQRGARQALMEAGGRIVFTGGRPYGRLASYARCFDVALLPYFDREPTRSGSSTRFYEHLAACRPMIATRAFVELLKKPPLLQLASDSAEAAAMLDQLHTHNFDDGFSRERWLASREATWDVRAAQMIRALASRQLVSTEPNSAFRSTEVRSVEVAH